MKRLQAALMIAVTLGGTDPTCVFLDRDVRGGWFCEWTPPG